MMTGDAAAPSEGSYGMASDVAGMLSRRAQIAAEILDTEKTYVAGLALIEKLFVTPLLASAQQPSPILTRKEVRQLFANFPDIITLSKELLAQLDARLGASAEPAWDAATGRVGDIFLRMAPFMKMYSLYLRNFRSALADISTWLGSNSAFAQFVQQTSARPECRGLTFQSYLLLPVQRIPRYKLLLEDMQRYTPQQHVDYASIGSALRMIADVADFVNENIEEHEMALSMIEIQRALGLKESLLAPGRRLIKAGKLTKICRKNHQQRSFYLFSDMLLYSGGPTPRIDDTGHRRVGLEDCKVMDVPDAGDCRHQFTIISREKSFIVYAATASSKASWMEALSQAILQQRRARETLQMDGSLKRRLARARRSTMMHFPRVAENFDAPVWDPDESSERCYICFRDFTLFLRRHHCRACGKIVCNACSRKNIMFVDHAAAEPKEGRGCDQCIARLFGREALDSPPGTLHRFLSRSRHSLDPGSLIQSLSALKVGSGSVRHLPAGRPSAPWGDMRRRSSTGDAAAAAVIEKTAEMPAAQSTRKRTSTESALEWDTRMTSGRSTLLYETPSPMSTISHHRVSLISSCSTIGGDAVLRGSATKARRPLMFSLDRTSPPPPPPPPPPGLGWIGTAGSQAALISAVAPPQVTLVQAEALARRGTTSATLCALCHGDFALADAQHQCASCLSLVCPRCIALRPAARGASMYIADGTTAIPAASSQICASCAAGSH
ncbi:hypothetical protein LPJ78_000679 [Coemansia sp. RSA 989]|nr:hypothetical protein LPJ78_000679 [Coemansia sp. RSA 989]KAJ1874705.1 hypothetical protein LPJ55_001312 [Coemansia sp. RSA 990]KAJ2673688.1 hypothetical protein IWW42_002100 [Coemansia sp. RSA 1085]